MTKISKIRPSLVNSCAYYARQTSAIYQALPYSVDFKAHQEFKAVLSKCSYIWNKGPINIWSDCKPQK